MGRIIRGILCDLDGTLVDSEPIHIEAWNATFEHYAIKLASGWETSYIGKPDADIAKRLFSGFPGLPPPARILDLRHSLFREMLEENRHRLMYPGVSEALAVLRKRGVKMAVGSNSIGENCRALLAVAGLDVYFDVVVSLDMVPNPKPAPDIFVEAARRVALPAASCAVVDDSVTGITAGAAAGCLTVTVLNDSPFPPPKADKVFPTTAEALTWLGAVIGKSA